MVNLNSLLLLYLANTTVEIDIDSQNIVLVQDNPSLVLTSMTHLLIHTMKCVLHVNFIVPRHTKW